MLTADARRQPLHHTMPPEIIGYSMPNKLHIRLSFVIFLCVFWGVNGGKKFFFYIILLGGCCLEDSDEIITVRYNIT